MRTLTKKLQSEIRVKHARIVCKRMNRYTIAQPSYIGMSPPSCSFTENQGEKRTILDAISSVKKWSVLLCYGDLDMISILWASHAETTA